MDGSFGRNLPATALVGWPLLILAGIGLGAILIGIFVGSVYVFEHLHWV